MSADIAALNKIKIAATLVPQHQPQRFHRGELGWRAVLMVFILRLAAAAETMKSLADDHRQMDTFVLLRTGDERTAAFC